MRYLTAEELRVFIESAIEATLETQLDSIFKSGNTDGVIQLKPWYRDLKVARKLEETDVDEDGFEIDPVYDFFRSYISAGLMNFDEAKRVFGYHSSEDSRWKLLVAYAQEYKFIIENKYNALAFEYNYKILEDKIGLFKRVTTIEVIFKKSIVTERILNHIKAYAEKKGQKIISFDFSDIIEGKVDEPKIFELSWKNKTAKTNLEDEDFKREMQLLLFNGLWEVNGFGIKIKIS